MAAKVNSVGLFGMEAFLVEVEADVSLGRFRFDVVGLPDTAVSESRERVRAALKNSGCEFSNNHITVNLAPADVRKEGPMYDLPILIAYLLATRQLRVLVRDAVFLGELSLTGDIRRINGALPMVIKARDCGFARIFLPAENAAEVAVVEGIEIYAVHTVCELLSHLNGSQALVPVPQTGRQHMSRRTHYPDFADVRGQQTAKRAIEVAAAGGHNILMIGPPGAGKSMLAKRIPSILPPMSFDEALETTKVYSIAGALDGEEGLLCERPFRSPHHSVSNAGLAGGGSVPKPGEISLANNGILFLDELPEFSREVMELLRQPLEDNKITISRVAGTLVYPCSVMLVAAMNPCPCGYFGHPSRGCTCTKSATERYLGRISGPLLDRIDIHIEVPMVDYNDLSDTTPAESSEKIRARVEQTRKLQQARFAGTGIAANAKMPPDITRTYCVLSKTAADLLREVFNVMSLSARGYDKILRVSRTIADLEQSETIEEQHIFEAIQYRSLDRKFWHH